MRSKRVCVQSVSASLCGECAIFQHSQTRSRVPIWIECHAIAKLLAIIHNLSLVDNTKTFKISATHFQLFNNKSICNQTPVFRPITIDRFAKGGNPSNEPQRHATFDRSTCGPAPKVRNRLIRELLVNFQRVSQYPYIMVGGGRHNRSHSESPSESLLLIIFEVSTETAQLIRGWWRRPSGRWS